MRNMKKGLQLDFMCSCILPAIMSDSFLKGSLSERILKALRYSVEIKDTKGIAYNARILQIMVREY